MNAKHVVGRKIVRVIQEKFWNAHIGKWSVDVKGFELDNGSVVSFHTIETGSDYATGASVWKQGQEKKEG
jgi:hypothetical protein